jgi:hypothetical protein
MSTSVTASIENRKADRRDASLVPTITAVRLSPQRTEARLINISTTGVLVECATRLQPGSSVTVIFEGGFTPSSVDSRVARSAVVAVTKGGGMRYQIGLAFKQPIELDELPLTAAPEPPASVAGESSVSDPIAIVARSVPRNRW